jgi:plasmid maintenance system antidote protein VapI
VFNSRNRQILKRRLLDSVTIEKLAEEFDMSDAQIKNIINKELSIIASKIS